MTPFEQALEAVKNGDLDAPKTHVGNREVDYFMFQFINHHFYMKIFASGMKARNANLKTYKTYYGLKSKSAKDCLVEFETIKKKYEDSKGAN